MDRGWFVGDFEPVAFKTTGTEVAIKSYKVGEIDKRHHHKIATEITTICSGEVEMNGQRFGAGDIIVIEPNESCRFQAIQDTLTVVVKVPATRGDKYLDE